MPSDPPKSFRALIGTPPSTATPTDSTLIIIDAQNEYATGKLRTVDVDSTSSAIATLLGRYRDKGGDVVHVLHRTPKGAPVFDAAQGEEMEAVKAGRGEKVCFFISGGEGRGGGGEAEVGGGGEGKMVGGERREGKVAFCL